MTPFRRTFPAELRTMHDDPRRLDGTAVTYTERNWYGEVIVPGTFRQSLANKSDRKPYPMLYGHNMAIGRWTEFVEERDGLKLGGRVSDTTLGNDVLTLVEDGALTGLSIGFFILKERFVDADEEVTFETPFGNVSYRFDKPTFYVTEGDVVETSIVVAPADDEARLSEREKREALMGDIAAAREPDAIRSAMERARSDDLLERPEREAAVRFLEARVPDEPEFDWGPVERELEATREALSAVPSDDPSSVPDDDA